MSVMHNEPDADQNGWKLQIVAEDDPRDRAQASLFRTTGVNDRPTSGRWTRGEKYALTNGLWIAERIDAAPMEMSTPLLDRPSIERLAHLAWAAGGVVVEELSDLGDDSDKAAVALYFRDLGRPLAIPSGRISPARTESLLRAVGGEDRVRPTADRLREIGYAAVTKSFATEGWFGWMGMGGRRDYEAAVEWAQVLWGQGCGRQEVIETLNIDGYVNQAGRRLWHTKNVPVAR